MANLNISSKELDSILGELENDLSGILADTQTKLAKAREEEGSASAGMGSASAAGGSPSASAGSPSASLGSPSAGSPSPSAGGEGAPPMGDEGGEAPPPGAEGGEPGMEGAPGEGAEGGEGGPVDPAALEQEYAQLPLEELKAHYLAAKAALFQQMGGGQGAGPSAGAPAGGPPPGAPAGGPPASPSPAGAPPMAMSEGKAVAGVSQAGNGGQGSAVAKSEVEDLKAQIEALTKIVTTVVNKPMQKAITGTSYVAKSEEAPTKKPVTQAEVTAKLSDLTRSDKLSKSDRDLITGFYEKRVDIAAIEHLLK